MRWRDAALGAALGAPVAGPLGSLVGIVGGTLLDHRRHVRRQPLKLPPHLQPHIVSSGHARVPVKRVPRPVHLVANTVEQRALQAALQAARGKLQVKQQWGLTRAKLIMERPHPWGFIGNSYVSAKDIAAWLMANNASPWEIYPEWPWNVVKGREAHESYLPLPKLPNRPQYAYVPGSPEAVCVIDYRPPRGFDAATWYVHQDGGWSYHHVWGENPLDVLGDVLHGVDSVLSTVTSDLETAINYATIAVALIPGIGQVVNEVIVGCETVLDVIEGKTALQIALDAAYQAGLAAVPGLESFRVVLDPAEQFLMNVAGGEKLIRSAADLVLDKLPQFPDFNGTNPRSLVGSLLTWLMHQLHITDVG